MEKTEETLEALGSWRRRGDGVGDGGEQQPVSYTHLRAHET